MLFGLERLLGERRKSIFTSCLHLGKHNNNAVTFHASPTLRWTLILESSRQSLKIQEESALALGNPAASAEVKGSLKAFTSEQLQAAVTPKQATPLFPFKLVRLSRYIHDRMATPGISATQLVAYARDVAFFKKLFFSGDRANDLSLVNTQEIKRFPVSLWGKSLMDGSSNRFGIRHHSDLSLCPIKAIEKFMSLFPPFLSARR